MRNVRRGRVGGRAKTENLTLLFFEFLLLYNVRLHFRFSPAVEVGLTLPGDAKSLRGDVLGDGAAGGGVGPVADGDGGDKVGVAADEAVVADLSAELVLAVVVCLLYTSTPHGRAGAYRGRRCPRCRPGR